MLKSKKITLKRLKQDKATKEEAVTLQHRVKLLQSFIKELYYIQKNPKLELATLQYLIEMCILELDIILSQDAEKES